MHLIETYFAFHRPATILEVIRGKKTIWQIFGHVEAFGYTNLQTWVFFDPSRKGTYLSVTHMHDEVNAMLAGVFANADEIYCTKHRSELRFPAMIPMNCAGQCAHLIGESAFTPRGLRRKLLKISAVKLESKNAG